MLKEKQVHVIQIRGAKTHNLKNIDIDIKLNTITCIAGPSGSGKTSLAFHTLLTESKRRFINSLPTDMKFFWEIPHTVDVDKIYPVLPAWGLPQHNPVINSRPTALDVIGGLERLQKVFMVLGSFLCPIHHVPYLKRPSYDSVINEIGRLIKMNDEADVVHVFISAADYRQFVSIDMNPNRSMNDNVHSFKEDDPWYEIVRVKVRSLDNLRTKIQEFQLGHEVELRFYLAGINKNFKVLNSFQFQCPHCEEKVTENKVKYVESLSPLNALGACTKCSGHGMLLVFDREKLVKDPTKTIREGAINFLHFSRFEHLFPIFLHECKKNKIDVDTPFEQLSDNKWTFLYEGSGRYEGFNQYFEYLKSLRYKKNIRIYTRSMQREILCESCEGTRISESAGSLSIPILEDVISYKNFLKLNIKESLSVLKKINKDLKDVIKKEKLGNTLNKLELLFLIADDLSLGHIHNTRKVRSMSSSEYQRLLLAKYLSHEGSQSLFVLDEPSLGLSLNAQGKILKYLRALRDQGNTILLVEHSEFLKKESDEVIEMGPGAGARGGEILFQGTYRPPQFTTEASQFLFCKKKSFIKITGAKIRNLYIDELIIQKNAINWAYGESGTGKTSFLVHLLGNEVYKKNHGTRLSFHDYQFKKINGINDIKDVILINSSLDKISPRSTVATYTDLGGFVRKYFASLEISKNLGLKEGHFSSNSELGQCSSCEGKGVKLVEMHFMEDVEFVCEDCQGKKIKPYYAKISDGHLNAFEAFNNPLSEVLPHIKLTPKGKRIWEYFKILKLDYLSLDRSLTSLSGGERQRLQLVSLLDKKTKNNLIIFENLTSGLSYHEFVPLADLLNQLKTEENTLIIIDQNPFFQNISENKIQFIDI